MLRQELSLGRNNKDLLRRVIARRGLWSGNSGSGPSPDSPEMYEQNFTHRTEAT